MYNVFNRTWWKDNPEWPDGLEPEAGRKTYMRRNVDLETALRLCKEYNEKHKPGKYSRKAEFEQA